MKKVLISIILCLGQGVQAENIGCGLEVIPENNIEYGCGCGYWYKTKPTLKPILQSERFDFSDSKAYTNGSLVKAVPIKVEQLPENLKVGDKFQQHYKIGDIDVFFDNTVSFVCPSDSESCEVTGFSTEVSVRNADCKVILSEISGHCGC